MTLDTETLEIIKSDEVLEPETLRQLYPGLPEKEFNQIMALKTLMRTQGFWENMYIFEDIVHALNGRIPDFTQIEGCLPEELWYALDIAHKLFPDHEYSIEVLKYIEFFMNENGVFIYPAYLNVTNPYLSKAIYMAEHGPFPLGESVEEIQAAKYLAIQDYIKTKKGII